MNPRFPVLSPIALITRVTGWVTIGLSILSVLITLSQSQRFASTGTVALLMPAFLGVGAGLLQVIVGEAIGVLFAIEDNTRSTADAVQAKGGEHLPPPERPR
jgi:hypothetical protein